MGVPCFARMSLRASRWGLPFVSEEIKKIKGSFVMLNF